MKSLYSIAILFFCFIGATQAQNPSWLWAETAPNGSVNSFSQASNISADGLGNIYAVGYYQDTITLGTQTFISPGHNSLFIAKYNSAGSLLWAKSSRNASINSEVLPGSLSTDSFGNVYLISVFADTIILGNDTFIANETGAFFIAKYDSAGNLIWTKSAKDHKGCAASGICTDAQGNVYITGGFVDTFSIGTLTLIDTASSSACDVFTAKYDPAGNLIWAKSSISSPDYNWGGVYNAGSTAKIDGTGNVYIGGSFVDTITFGAFTLESVIGPNAVGSNIFIVKYDSSGNVIWAKSGLAHEYVNDGFNYCTGISTDDGNVYISVVGDVGDTVAFGANTLVGPGVFVIKYNSSGNIIWTKSSSSHNAYNNINGGSICKDIAHNIYMIGTFFDTIAFGNDILISTVGPPIGSMFIVKYDSLGNLLWVQSEVSSNNFSSGSSISMDGSGNIYISGYFGDTITLGNTILQCSDPNSQFLIAKLGDITNGIPTLSILSNITIYPNPSTSTFYFSGVQSASAIEIYDILGGVVYSGQTNADIYPVSLSGQTKGMYFYKVSNNAGTIQQGKIILE